MTFSHQISQVCEVYQQSCQSYCQKCYYDAQLNEWCSDNCTWSQSNWVIYLIIGIVIILVIALIGRLIIGIRHNKRKQELNSTSIKSQTTEVQEYETIQLLDDKQQEDESAQQKI